MDPNELMSSELRWASIASSASAVSYKYPLQNTKRKTCSTSLTNTLLHNEILRSVCSPRVFGWCTCSGHRQRQRVSRAVSLNHRWSNLILHRIETLYARAASTKRGASYNDPTLTKNFGSK